MNIKELAKRILRFFVRRVSVKFHGMTLTGGVEDYGFLKALQRNEREPFMFKTFVERVKPGMTIVDVGAHLGHYTLAAAKGVGTEGRVIAFEPNPYLFRKLNHNVATNRFTSVVDTRPCAVSDAPGKLTLNVDVFQPDFTSAVNKRSGARIEQVIVDAVCLDEVLPPGKLPDVIKVDVEGFELVALRGMQRTLSACRAAGQDLVLFIESNSEALAAGGQSPGTLKKQLEGLGFAVFVLREDLQRLRPFTEESYEGCHNLLCLLSGSQSKDGFAE